MGHPAAFAALFLFPSPSTDSVSWGRRLKMDSSLKYNLVLADFSFPHKP